MAQLVNQFEQELKRLGLKKSDLLAALGITYPTLKSKIENPSKFTLGEAEILIKLGFKLKLSL